MYSQNDGRSLTARTIDYLKTGTMVNPISGLLTSLTEQQQQYIAQATVDAMSLTSDILARHVFKVSTT